MATIITGTGSYIPKIIKTNKDFTNNTFYGENGELIATPNEEIVEKFKDITGIYERRYAEQDMNTSEMATEASKLAIKDAGIDPETIEERVSALADQAMDEKMAGDHEIWRQIEKSVLLERLDHYWKEHLSTLDALRQVVFLRAYAQKQPINEYKREAFGLFEKMLEVIREDVTRILSTSQLQFQQPQQGQFLNQ